MFGIGAQELILLMVAALIIFGPQRLPEIAAQVGKAIRDRIELARRVRGQTAEARVSLVVILAMTYFIGIIVWVSDPERMTRFLATAIGATLVSVALLLQGVGIVWTAAMTRMRY